MSETIQTDAPVAEKPIEGLEDIVIHKVTKKSKKSETPRARGVMSLSLTALKMILGQALDLQGGNLDGDTQVSILYESCLAGHLEPPRDLKKTMKDVRARQAELKSFMAQKEAVVVATQVVAAPVPAPNPNGQLQRGERVVVNDLSNAAWAGVGVVHDASDAFSLTVTMLTGRYAGNNGVFRRNCVTREVIGATPAVGPRTLQLGDRVSIRVTGSRHWNGNAEVIRAGTAPTDDVFARMLDGPRQGREGTFSADQVIFIAAAPSGRFRIGNRVVINEPTRPNWHNGTAEVISTNNGLGTITVRMLSQGVRAGQQGNFSEDRLTPAANNSTITVTAAESASGGRQLQAGDTVNVDLAPGSPWNGQATIISFEGEYIRVRPLAGAQAGREGNMFRHQLTLLTPVGGAANAETFPIGAEVTVNAGPYSVWNGNGTVQTATTNGVVRVRMTSGSYNGQTGTFSRDQLTLVTAATRQFQMGDQVSVSHATWRGNGTVVSVNAYNEINVSMTSGARSGQATHFDRSYVTLVTPVATAPAREFQPGDAVTTAPPHSPEWTGNGTVVQVNGIAPMGTVRITMTSGRNVGMTTNFTRSYVTLVPVVTPVAAVAPAAATPAATPAPAVAPAVATAPAAVGVTGATSINAALYGVGVITNAAPAAAPVVAPLTVGSRVRVTTEHNDAWAGDGDVVGINEATASVRMVSGAHSGQEGGFDIARLVRL